MLVEKGSRLNLATGRESLYVNSHHHQAVKRLFGEDVFVMGYCNDVMNYIPSDDMWDEGGYEVDAVHCEFGLPGQWTRDVMTRIMDAARRLVVGKYSTAPTAAENNAKKTVVTRRPM